MTLEKMVKEAKAHGDYNEKDGLVMCYNGDAPASASMSKIVGWLGCAPCITGEADSFDEGDLIPV